MLSIEKCSVPVNTLLDRYTRNGSYADCYRSEIPKQISLNQFVLAFYTTSLFKLERFILNWTVSKPSTDSQAMELVQGDIDSFAAWNVEARKDNELLMCDFGGRTRSWFMVNPINLSGGQTQLYFGSAVVPVRNPKTRELSIEFVYRVLLGFHQIYSVLLLQSAKTRVKRSM